MTVRVQTTRQGDEHAVRTNAWWRTQRTATPSLFVDELTGALELLAEVPDLGRRYRRAGVPGLRRLLLPRSRHHVYYVHDSSAPGVVVLAVWAAVRRSGAGLS